MAGTLHLRARDVCRVCMVLVLWGAGITVYAQSVGSRKVSYAFHAARLDEVIRQLSLDAGVSFIYSSNKTNLSKVVTLKGENQSLDETLSAIGGQLGIEFKIQGRYIMIKQPEAKPAEFVAGRVPVGRSSKTITVSAASNYYPVTEAENKDRLWIPVFAERQLHPVTHASVLTQVNPTPLAEQRQVSARRNHAGLFISVGSVLNDYSSGFELQAGIRNAYLVFTPTWMSSGRYHNAYGFGTSVQLARNLSFTPIYIFGKSSSFSSTWWRNSQGLTEMKLTEKMVHHQVKLMLQYAVAPSVMLKLGPTLNQSSTVYNCYQTTTFAPRRAIIGTGIDGGSAVVVVVDQPAASQQDDVLSEQRVRKAWIGWEASVAIKVNFSPKK